MTDSYDPTWAFWCDECRSFMPSEVYFNETSHSCVRPKDQSERIQRLVTTIHKLTKWSGVEVSDLVEDGYLQEGDLDA